MVKPVMRVHRVLGCGGQGLQFIGGDKTAWKIRKLAAPRASGVMLDVNRIKHAGLFAGQARLLEDTADGAKGQVFPGVRDRHLARFERMLEMLVGADTADQYPSIDLDPPD